MHFFLREQRANTFRRTILDLRSAHSQQNLFLQVLRRALPNLARSFSFNSTLAAYAPPFSLSIVLTTATSVLFDKR